MRLPDYLAANGLRAADMARSLGVSVSTITRAARGEVIPSPDLMRAIVKATAGAVQPNDFFDFADVSLAPSRGAAGEAA